MFKIKLVCHDHEDDEPVTITCSTFAAVLYELGWIKPIAGNYTIIIEPQIPIDMEAV